MTRACFFFFSASRKSSEPRWLTLDGLSSQDCSGGGGAWGLDREKGPGHVHLAAQNGNLTFTSVQLPKQKNSFPFASQAFIEARPADLQSQTPVATTELMSSKVHCFSQWLLMKYYTGRMFGKIKEDN